MKVKISLIAIVMAGLIVAGAYVSSTGSIGGSSSPAYSAGQSFGGSILNLYSIYKQNGRIDLSNANTLLQISQLAMTTNTVKDNLKNKDFYPSFVQGAVFGSQQKVNEGNIGTIIDTLTGLNLGGIVESATNGTIDSSTASSVTSALSSIFNVIGK